LRHLLDTRSDKSPRQLAQELCLGALHDDSLEALCCEAIASSPSEVEAIQKGAAKVMNKLVGKVMKLSRGTANAQAVRVSLENLLKR
jgi:aspartyl-tRNA(Asn)/glutamyl-tRNA(Gln) amidotransferase subunit B